MSTSQLEIHIKIVLPSVQSGIISLAGLTDFLSADADFHSFQIEATFRFVPNHNQSLISWLPSLSFERNIQDASICVANTASQLQKLQNDAIQKIHSTIEAFPEANKAITKQIYPQWVNDSVKKIEKQDMKLCESGVGGTYFISDADSQYRLSVFKPIDEEPGAPNNPKKNPPSFTPMMVWGSGAHREVAAHKLDRGFVGVPETHLVEVTNNEGNIKKGSLQKYIPNDGDCSDVGANKFSVDTIHRLGIFDIRILNMDRNDENLLVRKTDKEWEIVPIDHTYCFPKTVDSYFNWQYWNQTKKPFSSETLSYISSIDVFSDAKMLLETGIDEESVRNVTGSTLLLQKAASRGYNLFQIALMVSGKDNDLVKMISKATMITQEVPITWEERFKNFKTAMEAVIDETLDSRDLK